MGVKGKLAAHKEPLSTGLRTDYQSASLNNTEVIRLRMEWFIEVKAPRVNIGFIATYLLRSSGIVDILQEL